MMSTIYLLFSLIFLVIGLQFLRGKWIKIMPHRSTTAEERVRKNAEIVSPGLIGAGIGLFCLGFFKAEFWMTTGNAIFLFSFAYIVLFAIVIFMNSVKN